jgi:hypothetical protein
VQAVKDQHAADLASLRWRISQCVERYLNWPNDSVTHRALAGDLQAILTSMGRGFKPSARVLRALGFTVDHRTPPEQLVDLSSDVKVSIASEGRSMTLTWHVESEEGS